MIFSGLEKKKLAESEEVDKLRKKNDGFES